MASRIINQKKYDTETAECLLELNNGKPANEHGYEYKAVYRKKTGEYFLHIVSKHYMQEWNFESINTFEDNNAAKEYCAKNLVVKDYEKIFGVVPE